MKVTTDSRPPIIESERFLLAQLRHVYDQSPLTNELGVRVVNNDMSPLDGYETALVCLAFEIIFKDYETRAIKRLMPECSCYLLRWRKIARFFDECKETNYKRLGKVKLKPFLTEKGIIDFAFPTKTICIEDIHYDIYKILGWESFVDG
ncbi:hypothetical protein HJ030_17320 [Vibrio parahaemolyticus]|uniref:hypothetical protein n=1 Tax=Vibrio parahaemolyticus TaxID=670 RepID=UPI0015D3343D|nr:hypothetical protein [Vibrio parahaemolyticus]MBE4384915.1 hypothetical protein [Vibrio parahaemolyticus]MEA5230316.1 hypothetical protein [Vibrio parahaemolyticus]NYU23994.1 hypothetical protein [Vibrio parahaemolyticus]